MKNLIVLLISMVCINHATIIDHTEYRGKDYSNGVKFTSYCKFRLDTYTRNMSYDCVDMFVSEILIYDSNDLVISRANAPRRQDGYITMPMFNGVPSYIGAYGSSNIYATVKQCYDGYTQIDGKCKKPTNCTSSYYNIDQYTCRRLPPNSTKTGNYTYKCNDGYDMIDHKCIKIDVKCPLN